MKEGGREEKKERRKVRTALTRRYLADSCWVPVIAQVRVRTLHKDTSLRLTLSIHLPTNIEQVHPLPNVPACLLNLLVPVEIGEESQAEPVC